MLWSVVQFLIVVQVENVLFCCTVADCSAGGKCFVVQFLIVVPVENVFCCTVADCSTGGKRGLSYSH